NKFMTALDYDYSKKGYKVITYDIFRMASQEAPDSKHQKKKEEEIASCLWPAGNDCHMLVGILNVGNCGVPYFLTQRELIQVNEQEDKITKNDNQKVLKKDVLPPSSITFVFLKPGQIFKMCTPTTSGSKKAEERL